MATGRASEHRTVTLTTTNASAAITATASTFSATDVGRTVTAAGIPTGATISAVGSDTAATLSANATATGARTATLGPAAAALGYTGWSPETAAEADDYTVAAAIAGTVPADVMTNPHTQVQQRARG